MTLVLASTSAARRQMLASAGVPHEAIAPRVDELALKESLGARGLGGRETADALAEVKAVKVSQRLPGALVLGADQILATQDRQLLDKPESRDDAAAQLRLLRGSVHKLISAAVIALDGQPVWRAVDQAELAMRHFSDAYLDQYLDREWPEISGCVGCYRLEGMGVQLFSRVRGNYFTVLGLPLLPVLDFLRIRGVLPS